MTSLNLSTSELQAIDGAHHLHPFTDFSALQKEGTRIISRADGCRLWDSDGTELIDGMAGLWCVNIGYGRKELAEAAYRQMAELPYYNTFFKTSTAPATLLSQKLVELTPDGLNHVYFANSGSEANDTIVRIVRHYWNLQNKPNKKTIISREFAYHGSTMISASLGGMSGMHEQADLPLDGFVHIRPPYTYRDAGNMTDDEFGIAAAQALEEKILELGADNIAAFIAEPIQGAGGVLVPPASYFPEIQRICKAHDILFIVDEVICGFGRTGNWFGADTFDLQADIMTLAKGLSSGYMPISAVMVGDRVSKALFDAEEEFAHGFTYSGHPVAAAVALENLRIMEEEGLIDAVREDTGPYLQESMRSLLDHPLVGEVRGIGFVGAIELVRDKDGPVFFEPAGDVGTMCRDHCIANGVILRGVRDGMVFSPPLMMSRADIDEMVEKTRKAIDLTQRDLGL